MFDLKYNRYLTDQFSASQAVYSEDDGHILDEFLNLAVSTKTGRLGQVGGRLGSVV